MAIVEVDPEKCNGQVVVKGTRLPVKRVIACINAGHTLEEIAGFYEDVTNSDLKRLMRYLFLLLLANIEPWKDLQ